MYLIFSQGVSDQWRFLRIMHFIDIFSQIMQVYYYIYYDEISFEKFPSIIYFVSRASVCL